MCAVSTPGSVLLTATQGNTMHDQCSIKSGC